ncbi:hypothetical protein HPB47_018452 [Ixodes persulcatus]|uniref:Uncharacterized protein n=1 Tax=Ixodes persulcatus TaxID=34615 RepID=A0AC60QKQ4_IXOPE|nr:hypothetical protein HPB47_018452 [Ixodes persulcatus]
MSQPRTCRQPPELRGSVHLTAEENETLASAVCDRKWEVLALGIAEVYRSGPPPRHDRWCRFCCGVVCFIKDNAARAFFIRVFDFDRSEFAWEQELFLEFSYNAQLPYFHTFEADKRRNQVARSGGSVPKHDPQIPMGPSTNGISSVSKKQSSGGKKSKKQKERKYTKADISCPTDFVHVQHVGWHPEKGFDFQNYVEETELTRFFEMAMVTEKDLKEPSTRAFIYEFIERNGGVDVIKEGVGKTEGRARWTGRFAESVNMDGNAALASEFELPFTDRTPTEREYVCDGPDGDRPAGSERPARRRTDASFEGDAEGKAVAIRPFRDPVPPRTSSFRRQRSRTATHT